MEENPEFINLEDFQMTPFSKAISYSSLNPKKRNKSRTFISTTAESLEKEEEEMMNDKELDEQEKQLEVDNTLRKRGIWFYFLIFLNFCFIILLLIYFSSGKQENDAESLVVNKIETIPVVKEKLEMFNEVVEDATVKQSEDKKVFESENEIKPSVNEQLLKFEERISFLEFRILELSSLMQTMRTKEKDQIENIADYALYKGGARIIRPKTFFEDIFFSLGYISPSVELLLQPPYTLGSCYSFYTPEYVNIKLSQPISVGKISIFGITKAEALKGDLSSAPKDIELWSDSECLISKFQYSDDGGTQRFDASNSCGEVQNVHVAILSNHGADSTCMYGIGIHE
jgi:hypothetical protein